MPEKTIILTYEGLKEYESELQELKTVKRKQIAEKIKDARSQGDLSENAEYDAAKEEQAEVEARISQIEKTLRNAEVIDEEGIGTGVINIGSRVKLFDYEYKEDVEYTIVGSTEADPTKGRISNESPLGTALLGRASGDTVEFSAPDGTVVYKILEISHK